MNAGWILRDVGALFCRCADCLCQGPDLGAQFVRSVCRILSLALACGIAFLSFPALLNASEGGQFREALGKLAPRAPEASLKSIRVRSGFEVELVCAEPLVVDPIAIDWGPRSPASLGGQNHPAAADQVVS